MTDNNFHVGPAKMSDGRFLTDYRTSSVREEENKMKHNIYYDYDYRRFLQKNTNNIINTEWKELKVKNKVNNLVCIHNYPSLVNPRTFIDERYNHDLKMKNQGNYPCKEMDDYRLTKT